MLLGLGRELAQGLADDVCQALEVPGWDHRRARQAWAQTRDIRDRARAVLSIVMLLQIDGLVFERLLAAASVTSSLPPSCVWDCERSQAVFPARRMAGVGTGRGPP
jgi:hypothetical protein